MNNKTIVINLSENEKMQLERIVLDDDKDEALKFSRELYQRIKSSTIHGLKSHLDM